MFKPAPCGVFVRYPGGHLVRRPCGRRAEYILDNVRFCDIHKPAGAELDENTPFQKAASGVKTKK